MSSLYTTVFKFQDNERPPNRQYHILKECVICGEPLIASGKDKRSIKPICGNIYFDADEHYKDTMTNSIIYTKHLNCAVDELMHLVHRKVIKNIQT